MAESLILRLSDTPGASAWISVDASGARSGVSGQGSLLEAAAQVGQRRVVVLVPSDEVLLTTAELPVRGAARIRQALPFALEEQVAEDLSRLHFAAGRHDAGGRVIAAVVRRERLETWLQRLQDAGIEPSVVTAEHGAVPQSPTATIWLVEGSACLVRTPGAMPIRVEGDSLEELLMFADPRGADAEGGDHLTVYLDAADQSRLGDDLEALRESLTSLDIRLLPDGLLPQLASAVVRDDAGVNLLQGAFAPHTGIQRMWRPWRLAASLLVGLIAMVIIQQAAELIQLRSIDKQLDQNIESVFRAAMPDVQRMVRPRQQMESRLAAIRAARGDSAAPFLATLESVSRALTAAPEAKVESLSFRNGIMELKISAPSVDSLDRIQRQIEAAGSLKANILSANPRGDAVEGRIQLTETDA